jgi:hypothetical protein
MNTKLVSLALIVILVATSASAAKKKKKTSLDQPAATAGPIYVKFDKAVKFSSSTVKSIDRRLNKISNETNVAMAPADASYEGFSILVSSMDRCVDNMAKKKNQPYNEIVACLGKKSGYTNELKRAVKLAVKISEAEAVAVAAAVESEVMTKVAKKKKSKKGKVEKVEPVEEEEDEEVNDEE